MDQVVALSPFTSSDPNTFQGEIKKLSVRSNWRGAFALLRNVSAIAAITCVSISLRSIWVYVAATWAIGAFQFAMSECLVHEACHYNLFRSRRMNDLCELFIGLPFFLTIDPYRREHGVHHIRVLKPDDDLRDDYVPYGLYESERNLFWLWFLKPLLGFGFVDILTSLSTRETRHGIARIALFWSAATIGCWMTGTLLYCLAYWIVPMIFCSKAFFYWSEISDHYATKSGMRTRPGTLSNLLFHNNGYHHAHHRYPSVTQFNLKKAHALTSQRDDDISHSFLDTYRQICRS